jgi:hypothetical protein
VGGGGGEQRTQKVNARVLNFMKTE